MASIQELEVRIEKLEKNLFLTYHHVTPIGVIMAFAAQFPPSGWLICNGHEYRIEEFKLLYNVIGDMYNTEETPEGFFCVPDLRGQFIRGWDGDGNVDPEREFGKSQEDALQGHGHELASFETMSSGQHTHRVYYDKRAAGTWGSDTETRIVPTYHASSDPLGASPGTDSQGAHRHTIPTQYARTIVNSNFGLVRCANETRPKNIALLYCIKAK